MSAEGKKITFSSYIIFFCPCVSLGPLRSRRQDGHERILLGEETPVRKNGKRARKCDSSLTFCDGRMGGRLVEYSTLLGAQGSVSKAKGNL